MNQNESISTGIPEDIFGSSFDCPCGKTHHILPKKVVYGEDALDEIPGILGGCVDGRRVAVLFDVRTGAVAGGAIVDRLRADGWIVTEALVPDP